MVLKTENSLTRLKRIFSAFMKKIRFFFFIALNAPPLRLLAIFSFFFFPKNNILLTSIHMNTLIRENYFLSSQFTLCSLQHRELKIFFICLILLSLPIVTNVQNRVLHSNVSFCIIFMPTKYIKLERKFLR